MGSSRRHSEGGRGPTTPATETNSGDADASAERSPLFDALAQLARVAYPVLLTEPNDPFRPSGPPGLFLVFLRHPAGKEFQRLALADPALSRLVKQAGGAVSTAAQIQTSTGRGGGVQVELLASLLIHSAHVRYVFRRHTTETAYLADVAEVLSEARCLLQGVEAEVPVLQSFAFVTLPTGRSVKAPWGVLRAPSEAESDYGSRLIGGSLSYDDEFGSHAIQYSGDLILDAQVPMKAKVLDGPPEDQAWSQTLETLEELERRGLLVSLAVTLAVEREKPAAAVPTWRVVLDPLDFGPSSSRRQTPTSLPVAAPASLTDEEATAVETWLEILEQNDSHRTAMAARRIQSSIVERSDPADGLVDAVVAWESLFGSREETTLRVSGSIACLLGTDLAKRLALQEETKKIYNLRSRIVHGDAAAEAPNVYDAWKRACDIGIQVLRRLYRDRPDLLALDPNERSLHLLLGD
jgi:hypothetical protein